MIKVYTLLKYFVLPSDRNTLYTHFQRIITNIYYYKNYKTQNGRARRYSTGKTIYFGSF